MADDSEMDLRYLIRKAIVNLKLTHPEAYADPFVSQPLEQARRVADRRALMSRCRMDLRGYALQDWKEAA